MTQLESVIRADPDVRNLAEDKTFQHVTSRMPPRVSLMGIQLSDQQMRMIYNLVRTNVPDSSTLPEFDAIKHYFLPGVTYAVPNAQGFEYVTYTLDEDVSR